MGTVMKVLKKLKPLTIDMLLFQYPAGDETPSIPEINGIKLQQKGHEFTIHENETLVHRSRIFYKSNLLSNFGFSGPLLTIGDCLTNDSYRGKGIYPKVLDYLGKKFSKERKVYILVAPDNSASIRGIEKAGFTFVTRLKAIRFLVFYFNKNTSFNRF